MGSEGARGHGNVMVVIVGGGWKCDGLGAGSGGHGVVVRVCQCVCRLRQLLSEGWKGEGRVNGRGERGRYE